MLVIDVALLYKKIELEQLFGEFGTTTNYIILSLHNIAERLGSEHALTLFFLHAFSGCDTVSSFFKFLPYDPYDPLT